MDNNFTLDKKYIKSKNDDYINIAIQIIVKK